MLSSGKEINGHSQVSSMESTSGDVNHLNKHACACVLAATIISAIFGYVTTVMAGALLFIKEELEISDIQVQLLAGILNACALPACMIAGRLSDYIGRRYTIMLSSIFFFLGSILMGYGSSFPILMIGRCIAGFGVGFALIIVSVYSAEISSPSYRGFLTSLPDLSINIGFLLGYVSNFFLGKLSLRLGWRIMLAIPSIPSIGLVILMLQLVESPRWLVMQGRLGDAKKVLLLISNSKQEAEQRMKEIKNAVGIDENCIQNIVHVSKKTRSGGGALKEMFYKPSPHVYRILIAAIGVHIFQNICGVEGIFLYSPRIFGRMGITDKGTLLLATVGIGISQTLFTLLSCFLLDKIGRRILLLVSSGGVILSMLGLCVCSSIVENSKLGEEPLWAIIFTIIVIYIMAGFNAIGIGAVTWVYSTEIFPLRLRAQGLGVCVIMNRITNVVVVTSFISIYKTITLGGTFFLFVGTNVLGWWFYYSFLPETKGRSLEDMETIFGKDSNSGLQMKYGSNNA